MKEKEIQRLQELKEIENKIREENQIEYICGIDEAGHAGWKSDRKSGNAILSGKDF